MQRQMGQVLNALGRYSESQSAFEKVLRIDPTDSGARQFLASIYATQGLMNKSDQANAQYLKWRDDPLVDVIAQRFYAAHPEWTDERIGWHIHSVSSAVRPVSGGKQAAKVEKQPQ